MHPNSLRLFPSVPSFPFSSLSLSLAFPRSGHGERANSETLQKRAFYSLILFERGASPGLFHLCAMSRQRRSSLILNNKVFITRVSLCAPGLTILEGGKSYDAFYFHRLHKENKIFFRFGEDIFHR